jgi:hypothetical protein
MKLSGFLILLSIALSGKAQTNMAARIRVHQLLDNMRKMELRKHSVPSQDKNANISITYFTGRAVKVLRSDLVVIERNKKADYSFIPLQKDTLFISLKETYYSGKDSSVTIGLYIYIKSKLEDLERMRNQKSKKDVRSDQELLLLYKQTTAITSRHRYSNIKLVSVK